MIKRILQLLGLYHPLLKIKRKIDRNLHEQQEKNLEKKRLVFYSGFLKQGDLVFDVGANVGNRVQSFLQIGCKVVAVEPQQECYELLEKKFGHSIEIVKMGLGEKDEEKTMHIANESTISSLSEKWIESVKQNRFKQYEWNKQVQIKITTLDSIISKLGKPEFCKIDVEGYEYEVLKGLSQPIKCISMEYTVPEGIDAVINCINHCLKLNPQYTFNYSVGENMVYQLPRFVSSSVFLVHIQTPEFLQTGFGDIYVMQ